MYKKKILLLLLVLLTIPAIAKTVDKKTAASTASELLRKQVVDATPADFTECYLFVGIDGTGFALIAADDCVPSVVGYSHTAVFPTDQPLPHHIATWINAYQSDIAASRKAGVKHTKFSIPRDTAVGPLLTTTWNQSPWYNTQCPRTLDSSYSVTGCVATAMAQVMKYWNHPAVGRGSHTYTPTGFGPQTAIFDTTHYQWNLMPNALGFRSSDEEVAAVAQLMYHAGVAVDMAYSPQSSGAYVSSYGDVTSMCAENALKNFFRYNQSLFAAARADYTNAQWDTLLTTELNASRPIFYSGTDNDGGHAFVLDGYDSLGLYHVNWGWGGYCDGYYTFDNLSPTGSGIGGNASNAYSSDNYALLYVFPASEAATVTVSVVPSDTLMGSVTGGGTFASYRTTTLHATASEGYRFLSWKSGNHYNPFTFSPNNDYADTALFVPIYGDTLGYCFSVMRNLWGEYGQSAPEWGIRIPAVSIPSRRQLTSVQFFGVGNADYTVKVFLGSNFDQQIFTADRRTHEFEWVTVDLPAAVPLIDSLPIWVILTSRSYSNPAVVSAYSGNPDGSWYKRAGTTWEHLEDRNEYSSWMIRAILSELEQVSVTAESGNPDRGNVSIEGGVPCGTGTNCAFFYPGDTAVLTANPAVGYRFAGWSTGERENPLQLRVISDETITATFVADVSIAEVEDAALTYTLDGLTLNVTNPSGQPVDLYDISGRNLFTSRLPLSTIALPAPGIYLLRCGAHERKIVAIQ